MYKRQALNRSRTLWLDVGEFSSHIGFESAISADNYTLSRSLMAVSYTHLLICLGLTVACFILCGLYARGCETL